MNSYLDSKGVEHLWKKLSLEDYPNNETLVAILNAIDETKADKSLLDDYLTKKDYIAGESGGTIDLSNFLTKTEADNSYASKNLLESIYPVGAIYLSANELNPKTIFGFGEWTKIEGKFLLGASVEYPLGSIGGEQTHTLTIEEIPSHSHSFNRHQLWRNETVPESGESDGYGVSNKTLTVYSDNTSIVGNNQPHNNMPPYIAIFIWQRIS